MGIKLSKRLLSLTTLITKVGTVVDVGCDHGHLSQYLLQHGLATKVIACDISQSSLNKVTPLQNLSIRQGNGLNVLARDEVVDTVIIAGLGGMTILDILQNFFSREDRVYPELILSPQSQVGKLREFLNKSGFMIVEDFVLLDVKFYDIIKAVYKNQSVQKLSKLDDLQLQYGVFFKRPNEALKQRLNIELQRLSAFGDLKLSDINKINEVLKWQ
ncbi:MAG: class I SAM-dependent methyltransferase [Clostridiales bacterium]|jgi:tRNA (adenine22-N1)-methyltransferase|nr:class I SAM-dependent methyltransferase [Clostridiales bacterium]